VIKLNRQIITGIRASQSGEDLHKYLMSAIMLEHSTIPPYLTAMFSLKQGTNQRIGQLIRTIVVEEMLHMTIASNILIAVGGHPEINTKGFVPNYPGPLPMGIVSDLTVGIEAFSIRLVKDIFMSIEQPEDEVLVHQLAQGAEPQFATIGEFYNAIQKQIEKLGQHIFVQPNAPPQVVASQWFPPGKLFPITGPASACRAIDIVKLEGEGTSSTPFQAPGDPAHFYKFQEIAAGRELTQTAGGFADDGPPILFDPSGVWPLRPNCKIADFQLGTQARTRIERFAYSYSSLLNALHQTFNGDPDKLDSAIGMMYDLRVQAAALIQTDVEDGSGMTVGPSFEFVDTQGGMQSGA